MRGIDGPKHEVLMEKLEEIIRLIDNPEEVQSFEADYANLSDTYHRYTLLLSELRKQVKLYYSLYGDIQIRSYRELRRIRRSQSKTTLK